MGHAKTTNALRMRHAKKEAAKSNVLEKRNAVFRPSVRLSVCTYVRPSVCTYVRLSFQSLCKTSFENEGRLSQIYVQNYYVGGGGRKAVPNFFGFFSGTHFSEIYGVENRCQFVVGRLDSKIVVLREQKKEKLFFQPKIEKIEG